MPPDSATPALLLLPSLTTTPSLSFFYHSFHHSPGIHSHPTLDLSSPLAPICQRSFPPFSAATLSPLSHPCLLHKCPSHLLTFYFKHPMNRPLPHLSSVTPHSSSSSTTSTPLSPHDSHDHHSFSSPEAQLIPYSGRLGAIITHVPLQTPVMLSSLLP